MTRLVAGWPGRIAALIVVATLAGGVVVASRGSTAAPAADTRTTTVQRGNITQTVSVSGSIDASSQTRLGFKSGGRLAALYVTVGQAVQAGAPLAQLDTADLQSAVRTAQQNLATAQASHQKAILTAAQTRGSLSDTQRSGQTSVANAQTSLDRLRASYATAKTSFSSLTDGAARDAGAYGTAIGTMKTQVDQVITDIQIYGTADIVAARNALTSADTSLAGAQSYADGLLAQSAGSYLVARDGLLSAVTQLDAAMSAGSPTAGATAAFQSGLLDYNVALARLQTAIDTVTSQVSAAQTSVNAAAASLNSTNAKLITAFDAARADAAAAQQTFTAQSLVSTTLKTRLAQAGTPLGTIGDVVNGSLANAIQAVANAQDQSAQTVRSAQSAVDAIPFTLQSAEASVENAQNALDTANANLAAAVLTAPTAGTVASIANQVGEFVGGGNSNSAFIVLTNTNTLTLHATVGEADIASLVLGLAASVTVDALPGMRLRGKVGSLDPVATISQGVPVYGIDIAIDDPAPSLRAGMSATANVVVARKQGVLLVPNGAIRTIGGRRVVQVQRNGKTVDTAATFGISNDTVTEVTSGLSEGDVVVLPQIRAPTGTGTQQQGRPGGRGRIP